MNQPFVYIVPCMKKEELIVVNICTLHGKFIYPRTVIKVNLN